MYIDLVFVIYIEFNFVEFIHFFKKDFIYLLLMRGEGREKERERNNNVQEIDQLPLAHLQLGTWLTTQACALTENRTSNPLAHRLTFNPLSHSSQG